MEEDIFNRLHSSLAHQEEQASAHAAFQAQRLEELQAKLAHAEAQIRTLQVRCNPCADQQDLLKNSILSVAWCQAHACRVPACPVLQGCCNLAKLMVLLAFHSAISFSSSNV